MIAKIMKSSADKSFNAIQYATKKEELGKGELLRLKNFPLNFDKNSKGYELRNHLKFISQYNQTLIKTKVDKPQFHAVISAKGKESGKEELANIAEKWLEKMGYGKQPYVIVFHGDTNNNHVHIISTRVNIETGRKINDSMERYRSLNAMDEILGKELSNSRDKKASILDYDFQTKGQLKATLDKYWIPFEEKDDGIVVRWGKDVFLFSDEAFKKKKNKKAGRKRRNQIRAIFHRYRKLKNTDVFRVVNKDKTKVSFKSEFLKDMEQNFGLEVVFHKSENKDPFGYSLIDHENKRVYKGSEIMKLKRICNFTNNEVDYKFFDILEKMKAQNSYVRDSYLEHKNLRFLGEFIKTSHDFKAKEFLKNWERYQSREKYLKDYNLEFYEDEKGKPFLHDKSSNSLIDTSYSKEFKGFNHWMRTGKHQSPEIEFDGVPIRNLNSNHLSRIVKDFSYLLSDNSSEDIAEKRKRKQKRKGRSR